MNDTELDEMLDKWSVPSPSASLRATVRAGFAVGLEPKPSPGVLVRWLTAIIPGPRKALPAGAILGIGALLLVVTQALPRTPSPPYTVDSEFIRYSDDHSPVILSVSTSYNDTSGREIVLSRSIPSHHFGTAIGHMIDAVWYLWSQLTPPPVVNRDQLERTAALIRAGCADGAVVGRETILNYPTTAVERRAGDRRRMTLWMAPGLGCFALRITTEAQRPDGTFHLVTVKQALKVTLTP
jgi:hypothetical protein